MKKYAVLALFVSAVFANSDSSFRFIVVGDRTGGCVAGILEFE